MAKNPLSQLLDRFSNGGTAAETVYAVLREAIMSNTLAPGARLRADDLATQLGVSRTPIREALRKLEAEDLVTVGVGNALTVKILSEKQLLEIYYTREALEGMAARLAAENAGRIEIANLHRVLQDVETAYASSDLERVRTFTGEFQLEVFKASRNDVLFRLLMSFREQVRNHRITTMNVPGRDEETVSFCRELLKAIETRDADKAEYVARANRRRTLELRIKMMRSTPAR